MYIICIIQQGEPRQTLGRPLRVDELPRTRRSAQFVGIPHRMRKQARPSQEATSPDPKSNQRSPESRAFYV